MKTSIKALVLAATLSLIAGSSFAYDLTSLQTIIPDLTVDSLDIANASVAAQASTLAYEGSAANNTVVVIQLADGSFGYVEQTGGVGNLATIMQDSSSNPSVAIVSQNGNANGAMVYQH